MKKLFLLLVMLFQIIGNSYSQAVKEDPITGKGCTEHGLPSITKSNQKDVVNTNTTELGDSKIKLKLVELSDKQKLSKKMASMVEYALLLYTSSSSTEAFQKNMIEYSNKEEQTISKKESIVFKKVQGHLLTSAQSLAKQRLYPHPGIPTKNPIDDILLAHILQELEGRL